MSSFRRRQWPRHAQRGVVLLLALIMLIGITLAGLALYRQIGTGLIIARNLSFKRSSAIASDLGLESARIWLVAQSGTGLDNGNAAQAYYPGWCNTSLNAAGLPDADNNGVTDDCSAIPAPSEFDPVSYNWNNAVVVTTNDGIGNDIRYVVHRLCAIPGSINAALQQCVVIGSSAAGGSKGAASYGTQALTNTSQPYFRVTTRTLGPTNTVVYTQAIMY